MSFGFVVVLCAASFVPAEIAFSISTFPVILSSSWLQSPLMDKNAAVVMMPVQVSHV